MARRKKVKTEDDIKQEQILEFINIIKQIKNFSTGLKINKGSIFQSIDSKPHIIIKYNNPIFENKTIGIKKLDELNSLFNFLKKKTIIDFILEEQKRLIFKVENLKISFRHYDDLYLNFKIWEESLNEYKILTNILKDENKILSSPISLQTIKFLTDTVKKKYDPSLLLFKITNSSEDNECELNFTPIVNKMDNIEKISLLLYDKHSKLHNNSFYIDIESFSLIKGFPFEEGIISLYSIPNNNNQYLFNIYFKNEELNTEFNLYSTIIKK